MKKVKVSGEFIQLNQFMKMQDIVMSGGEAKAMIEDGQVKVNGEVTDVIRKKLRNGDSVEAGGQTFVIETEA